MEIDLFTLVAQILNLLILLFLLRKFLYLPVLKAVEARQKLIADEITVAEKARQKAIEAENTSLAITQRMEKDKQQILEKAQQEADVLAEKLKQKAEEEYRQKREQWHTRLMAEQQNFDISLQKAAAQYFNLFVQKAMRQLADTDLNNAAVKQLMNKISALSTAKKQEYTKSFAQKKQIEIQSALKLDNSVCNEFEAFLRLNLSLDANTEFIYTIKPELISGVCIVAEEQLIAWNFENYLLEFRQNMNKTVQQLLSGGGK